MKKRKGMAGEEWPPLVPHPPGHQGQELPDILPNIPSPDKGKRSSGSKDKVVTLEAGSLNSAYYQLEQRGLQPVPVVSTHLCQDSPKMKVTQGTEKMDWDLMRVAIPRCKGRFIEGTNMEDKALDGPHHSSILCSGNQLDLQMTVTMAKKKGRKKMTLAKKKQLENRSLFCGPLKKKPKKKKPKRTKKPKVEGKDRQGVDDVPPEVDLSHFLKWIYIFICLLRSLLHLRILGIRKTAATKSHRLWILLPR